MMDAIKYRRSGGIKYAVPVSVKASCRPWRASEAVTLAAMDVVIAGVSYLLSVSTIHRNGDKRANISIGCSQ